MKQAILFVRRHWITLGLLAAAMFGVSWIVKTQRAPGSMTIVEAQAMDMTTTKPPPGVLAVDVEVAETRDVVSEALYPATVAAETEEEIVARVPGRVANLTVYPGDRVKAGQIVGRLDAAELSAQSAATGNQAAAKTEGIAIARQEIAHHHKMLAKAMASLRGADAAISRAKADRETANAELQAKRKEIDMAKAESAEKAAELDYAQKNLAREKKLYEQKAISLDEYQSAIKERDASKARKDSAAARIGSVQAEAAALDRKYLATAYSLTETEAAKEAAQADVDQVQIDLLTAESDVKAAGFEAAAAKAANRGAQIQAEYRILRAMSDAIVAERVVSPGTAVMAGQTILRLNTVGIVRVQSNVPQSMAGQINVGTRVEVVTETGRKPAQITSVFPAADEQTRTIRVEAKTLNKDGSLVPGMFARMSFDLGRGVREIAVRTKAIQTDSNGSKFVWLMANRKAGDTSTDWTCTMHPQVSKPGPGKCPICQMPLVPRSKLGKYVAEKRSVRIGVANETWTAVLDGLAEHELVIVSESANLQPGTPVSPGPVKKEQSMPPSMEGMDH